MQNVIAPPKTKSSLIRDEPSSKDKESTAFSSSNADALMAPGEKNGQDESENSQSKESVSRSPPDSPARKNAVENPSYSPSRRNAIDSPFDSPSRKNAVESPFNSPTIRNAMESPTKKFDVSPSRKNNGEHSPMR